MTRDDARALQAQQIQDAVNALRSTEGWQSWLRARKHFHSYSIRNQMLIALQRPDATQVAGFSAWRKNFNRQVRKGSKAIWILAPSVRKAKIEGEEDRVFFRSVKVFAVEDTDQIEGMPEIPITAPVEMVRDEGDDRAAALTLAVERAEAEGISVSFADTGRAGGFYRPSDNSITLDEDAAPNTQYRTLVHELCHAYGFSDYSELGRALTEQLTEAAAFCVLDSLGYDASAASVPYVAVWMGDASDDQLQGFAKTIGEIANRVEALLEDVGGDDGAGAVSLDPDVAVEAG